VPESALVRVVGGCAADCPRIANRGQHGAPAPGARATDAGGLGSRVDTREGSGLTPQVDQSWGQVTKTRMKWEASGQNNTRCHSRERIPK
jgi:hypothetical protein